MTRAGRPTILLGTMWGYAEGNERVLTIVVALIVVAALAYIFRRYLGGR